MKTKEELVNTYIKYSSDITEEIWDKLVIKFRELGFYLWQNKGYKRYKEGSIIFINEKGDNSYWVTDGYFTPNADKKEIQVSDILGEESKFEVGKYYSYIWNWNNIGKCICKVSEVSKFQMRAEWDYMEVTKSFRMPGVGATTLHEISDIKELTQEEVQQYLPDNHPDKLPKTIEKWSVGSYVVFINSYGDSNKGDVDKIKNILDSDGIWCEKEGVTTKDSRYTRWFATLPEAEAFSKSLLEPEESKTLTINDLVEGEIYLVEYSSGGQYINLSNGKGDVKCYIDVKNKEYHKSSTCGGAINYTIASPQEKKWLLTCIKQDEFISPDQLDMYDSEGNLIEDKPKFKIGDYVITNKYSSLYNGRILRITKFSDRYPDIAYFEVFDDGYYSKNDNFSLDKVERFATSEEIAKVTKPEPKESKEFDRNWYVEVNSQEEADKVFEYLESIGEIVAEDELSNRKYMPNDDYKYIYYLTGSRQWFLGNDITAMVQKQLSDIIPGYSKVNRNVYYEVSNQEEHGEILDWLESMSEKVDRESKVMMDWKFIYYRSLTEDWCLGRVKPNLPKAEFQFKSKQRRVVKDDTVTALAFATSTMPKKSPIEETPTNEEVKIQLINVPRI